MKFSLKNYKTAKTKSYIQKNNLFFFVNGVNQDSNNWVLTEQSLKKINFNFYKIYNKTSKNLIKNSIYKLIHPTINGTTFLIKPNCGNEQLSKKILLNNFEPLLCTLLTIKLNNKVYPMTKLKSMMTLKYDKNKLLFFQFQVTNLKFYF